LRKKKEFKGYLSVLALGISIAFLDNIAKGDVELGFNSGVN
jgi:hypothetical protein